MDESLKPMVNVLTRGLAILSAMPGGSVLNANLVTMYAVKLDSLEFTAEQVDKALDWWLENGARFPTIKNVRTSVSATMPNRPFIVDPVWVEREDGVPGMIDRSRAEKAGRPYVEMRDISIFHQALPFNMAMLPPNEVKALEAKRQDGPMALPEKLMSDEAPKMDEGATDAERDRQFAELEADSDV